MHFLPDVTHAVLHLWHTYGILALFVLLLIEEAGVPLPAPGDTLIALAGARPHRTLEYTAAVLVACTAAVFLGSSLLYWLMRRGGRNALLKYGRFLHLDEARLDRMERWMTEHGAWAIVAGRLIPGLRIPTTVICGLSGVPYRTYGPMAALAGFLWAGIYFLLGAVLQRRMGIVTSFFAGLLDTLSDSTLVTTFAICLLIILSASGLRLLRKRGATPASSPTESETEAERSPAR